MARLEISLLGSPKIKLDGKLLTGLPAKAQALLFYLVVTKQQQTRERLAEMLFSSEEMRRVKKLSNLRGPGGLLALNEVLEEFIESPKFSVAFKTESDYWLDLDEFQACLRSPNPTPAQLQTAVNLYQAEFLTGLRLRDAEGFEEWAEQRRRSLETQIHTALYLLAVHYKEQRQYVAALACITRLLALNPYFEEANRELMLLLALTNQVNEACSHYEQYETLLAEDGLEPETETTALYQKIWRGEILGDEASILPMPAPPPQTWAPPFQAPPLLPHFVDREELVNTIVATLQSTDDARIQALVGMGGVGKSSLAGEIAHALQEHFSDGVLWASVAVSEPTAVLESWAQAYGYDFSRLTDLESMANAFRGVLADKRVLLVLDDVVSVSRIRPLLPNGPHCRVLLTTRDQDLAHGLDAQVWRLAELSPADGRRLLMHILGSERVEAEADAAGMICDLLQNLPLAVEIIGQRLKSRPRRKLADIVQRLRNEKQRLSELKISDRAVRASFAISYDTLDAQERQMFALMGLFHGRSFAADLMAAVADQDRYETEDRIFALVALSLAQEDGATRYRQHPLLADFAREKLGESGEEGMWYGRLAQIYLTFAQKQQRHYDALRPEWDNLMAAMQAAHDCELWPTVIAFADVLHDAWFARGRYAQARQGYQWVHKAAQKMPDESAQIANYLRWGEACIEQNLYTEANQVVQAGLSMARQSHDDAATASALLHLARIALEKAQYEEAMAYLTEARTLREQQGDEAGIATILYRLARIYHETNDIQRAEDLATQALNIQRQYDHKRRLIPTLRLLAQIALVNKAYDQAQEYCQQALELSEDLEDQGELSATLYVLCGINRLEKNYEKAREYGQKGMELAERMGLRRYQARFLLDLAWMYLAMPDYEKAFQNNEACMHLFAELEDNHNLAYAKINAGVILKQHGETEKARQIWLEARRLAETTGHSVALQLVQQWLSSLGD